MIQIDEMEVLHQWEGPNFWKRSGVNLLEWAEAELSVVFVLAVCFWTGWNE